MYTLTVTCQKGGTGKTTSCLALGAELTRAGYNVLFVDADPQANLTKTQLDKPFTVGLYDVLSNYKTATEQGIGKGRNGFILPSDGRLGQGGKYSPLYGKSPEYRIKTALESISKQYDIAIIDTAPSVNELSIAAMTAANGIIIPVRPDRYSLLGLQEVRKTTDTIRSETTNTTLKILGTIVTQFNARSVLAREVLETLRDEAKKLRTKVYDPPIRNTVSAQEWQYTGYTTGSTAAKDYAEITKQLITDMKLKRR